MPSSSSSVVSCGVSMPTSSDGPWTSSKAAASRSPRPVAALLDQLEPGHAPRCAVAVEDEHPAVGGRAMRRPRACRAAPLRRAPRPARSCTAGTAASSRARAAAPWRSRAARRSSRDPPQRRAREFGDSGAEVLACSEAEHGGGQLGASEHVPDIAEAVAAGGHGRRRHPGRRRRDSVAAISPTERGVPLATLNAPGAGSARVSASTLARATSRTWTKSRSCSPSS